jgi:hypothetical protein
MVGVLIIRWTLTTIKCSSTACWLGPPIAPIDFSEKRETAANIAWRSFISNVAWSP